MEPYVLVSPIIIHSSDIGRRPFARMEGSASLAVRPDLLTGQTLEGACAAPC